MVVVAAACFCLLRQIDRKETKVENNFLKTKWVLSIFEKSSFESRFNNV